MRGSFKRGPRRRSEWITGPATSAPPTASVTVSATGVQLAAIGLQLLDSGLTLVRLRGEMTLQLITQTAVGDGFHGALGICMMNEDAFAAGAGSAEDPATEPGWDGWLYHRFFSVDPGGLTAPGAVWRDQIDGRAMRKFDDDMVLAAVLEVVETGTASMRWTLQTRALFLLP